MLEESKLSKREKYTLILLCWAFALSHCNYAMAVSSWADIKKYYSISGNVTDYYCFAQAAGNSLISPVYGYLGDRYSRRILLMISFGIGSISHFISSFAANYPMLVASRAFVGIGLSGLRNIAPPVIASIVSHDTRTKLLAIFYICLTLGRGSGFVIGALISHSFGWWWTLRATLVFDITTIILLYFGVYPESGAKEAAAIGEEPVKATSYRRDLCYVLTNISFLLITFADICTKFVSEALWYWGGDYLFLGLSIVYKKTKETITQLEADLNFETSVTITGVTGVIVGSTLSYYQRRTNPAADTIICGICLIASWPFLTIALYTAGTNKFATLFFFFLGETLLHTNLAVVTDMLLYIVKPTQHATCIAITIFAGYAFGQMISPTLLQHLESYYELLAHTPNNWIEVHSEGDQNETDTGILEYRSLQMSLFTILLMLFIGAVCFLVNANFILKYRQKAEEIIPEE